LSNKIFTYKKKKRTINDLTEEEALDLLNQSHRTQNFNVIEQKKKAHLFKFKPNHLLSWNNPCIKITPASSENSPSKQVDIIFK